MLVLLVDPARRPPINAQRVAVTLGLTASEGRMAALLAEGLKIARDRHGPGLERGLRALADQAGLPEARRVGAGRPGSAGPGGRRPAGALTARRAPGPLLAGLPSSAFSSRLDTSPNGRIFTGRSTRLRFIRTGNRRGSADPSGPGPRGAAEEWIDGLDSCWAAYARVCFRRSGFGAQG